MQNYYNQSQPTRAYQHQQQHRPGATSAQGSMQQVSSRNGYPTQKYVFTSTQNQHMKEMQQQRENYDYHSKGTSKEV